MLQKKLGQHSFVLMCLNGFEIVCLFFLHAFWWFQLDKPSGLYKMQKLFLLVHIPVPTYWGQTLSICEDPPRGLWFCRGPPPHFLTVHLQNPCPQPDHPNWREDYNIHIIHIIIYDHIYVCIICTYIFVLILFTLYLRFQVCNRWSVIGTKQLQDPGDGMHPWLIQEARWELPVVSISTGPPFSQFQPIHQEARPRQIGEQHIFGKNRCISTESPMCGFCSQDNRDYICMGVQVPRCIPLQLI